MGSAGQHPLMAFAWHRLNRVPYRHLLLIGLLGCVCSFPVWADERPTPKSLWQTVLTPPAADQPPTPRRPWVLRDREIASTSHSLQILKDAGARPHPRITIELFDGANHELDITSTISRSNDTAIIRGYVQAAPHGRLYLYRQRLAPRSAPSTWAIASTRPSISPTAASGCSKSTPTKNAAGLISLLLLPCRVEIPLARATLAPCLDPTIWTVGHSTRPIDEFTDFLRAHEIRLLVDVRTIPRSRYNPQFNTDTLAQSLRDAGLQYRHLPELGVFERPKKDSINDGWRNASFRGYADYMQTDEFLNALEELMAEWPIAADSHHVRRSGPVGAAIGR